VQRNYGVIKIFNTAASTPSNYFLTSRVRPCSLGSILAYLLFDKNHKYSIAISIIFFLFIGTTPPAQ
jgi:hypothetical protein